MPDLSSITTASDQLTSRVVPTTPGISSGSGVVADKTTLDKDAFLQLLVTQMRYQDPSQPMDTTQVMAQTSQLAMVEQLTAMSETSRESFALQMRLSASSLVGRAVSYEAADGTTATGVVKGTSFAGEVPVLDVGGTQVTLDAVSAVRSA